jgi:hypothetical protein
MTNLSKKYAIDSCKLRIKLSEITILDNTILDRHSIIKVNDITGELVSQQQIKGLSKEIKFNGYSIKVVLTEFHDFKQKTKEEFLEVYLHSKILEQSYFDGITIKNISQIYHKLMTAKVFECSEQTFMTSLVNDIDIKIDFIASKILFQQLTFELNKRAKSVSKRGLGSNLYTSSKNLEFNSRQSSTLWNPFVKFYDKELESIEKNQLFFKDFPTSEIKDKKRLEVTIKKSSDIKQFFNIEKSNFESILNLSQSELQRFVTYAVKQNLKDQVKIEKSLKENKNAIDILIHIHFTNSIDNQNLTFLETMEEFLTHFDDKQMKIRIKKRANEWNFNRHNLKGVNKRKFIVEIEDKISGILSELGIV